jgi:general secretion pathway protein B
MSYILEALKKSQQERELGHVPRIQSVAFDERIEPVQPHRWVYLAVLLALLAVGVAFYAVLRRDGLSTGELTSVAAESIQAGQAMSTALAEPLRPIVAEPQREPVPEPVLEQAREAEQPLAPRSPRPEPVSDSVLASAEAAEPAATALPRPALQPSAPTPPAPEARRPAPRSPPRGEAVTERPQSPADPGGEPQVLVVPAPPKPGQPLPRGAEELRRAVLGEEPSSIAAAPEPVVPARERDEATPIPDDLIADIEAFKQQIRTASPPVAAAAPSVPAPVVPAVVAPAPRPPDVIGTKAASSSRLSAADIPPPASTELRQKLPAFKLTVHVYDADPSRRFVYINGRKLSERQKSREGLRLEQVLADGAILSWQGERFFERR